MTGTIIATGGVGFRFASAHNAAEFVVRSYLAGLDPTLCNETGIDVANYDNIDFSPVAIADADEISMAELHEPAEIDPSASFDIDGNPLSFEWKLNGDSVGNDKGRFSMDTSKTGMNRVKAKVSGGTKTVHRKYSVRETGIPVFAGIPEMVDLSAVTNLNSGTGLYMEDLL